ncbi:hypothetical protein ACOMHN_019673 [Nucella lapillus]
MKTNEYVRQRIDTLAGKHEPLLSVVKRCKLIWFGHVNRHDSLVKTILQGTVEGGRRRGRQREAWADNAKEWNGETFNSVANIRGSRPMESPDSSLKHGTPRTQVKGIVVVVVCERNVHCDK